MDSDGSDGAGLGDESAASPGDALNRDHEHEGEREVSTAAGHGTLSRAQAQRDMSVRRWNVVTPAATQIGRPTAGERDLSETVRRLHEERHPAMAGHSARAHRLDKLRVTQALCNRLDLPPWQRDRVLGIVDDLEFTAFGSQRSIPKVALVVIRHVVDVERRRYLGLEDPEYVAQQSPDDLERLYDTFQSIKDEPQFEDLLGRYDLDKTSLNRLRQVLKDQLAEQDLEGRVFGHNPYRDPNLPRLRERESTEVDPAD